MTLEARLNFQRGVIENKLYQGTNYTAENAIDVYVLSRKRIGHREEQQQKALEQFVTKAVENELIDCINKMFK